MTAVAVFRNPNTIPFYLTTDLVLNVLFSWLLVHLPSTFFLGKEEKEDVQEKPEPNEEYNSILVFFYSALTRMFVKRLRCTLYYNLYEIC